MISSSVSLISLTTVIKSCCLTQGSCFRVRECTELQLATHVLADDAIFARQLELMLSLHLLSLPPLFFELLLAGCGNIGSRISAD